MDLPDDVIFEQMKHMSIDDILRSCYASKQYMRVSKKELLWKYKIMKDFPNSKIIHINNYKQHYLELAENRALGILANLFYLGKVLWKMGNSPGKPGSHISFLDPIYKRPIEGFYRAKISDPYIDDEDDHIIEYKSNKPISPIDILMFVYNLADKQYTQAHADYVWGVGKKPVCPGDTIRNQYHNLKDWTFEGVVQCNGTLFFVSDIH